MKCVKCNTKMIPYGSPAERRRHKNYVLYGCPKCHNTSAVIKLAKNAIKRS